MRASVFSSAAFLVIACSVAISVSAQRGKQPRQQWEFKVIDHCHEADRAVDLRKLGEDGWEFVGASQGIKTEQSTTCQQYYFKRSKTAKTQNETTKPKAPTCSLPLEKAPTIRGLRLGMSLDELLAQFPGSKERGDIKFALRDADAPPKYGVVILRFHNNVYPENKVIFDDVRFYAVTLLDGKVMRIEATVGSDASPFSWTYESFATKLATTFELPGFTSWEQRDSYSGQKMLSCGSFEIWLTIHPNFNWSNPVLPISISHPILTINDSSLIKLVEQRVKDDHEKRRRNFKF